MEADRRPRSATSRRILPLATLAVLFLAFTALGTWQVERRAWKLDLIARVDARLKATPTDAPGPSAWPGIGKADEYRRLHVSGMFRHDLETCTQAVTIHGPGCWVLTPLQTAEGWSLLVNRGFVDPEHRLPSTRGGGQVAGTVDITGLLRLTEPGGGFLRANDSAHGRWTSRDVAAIASARGLPATAVAPYFLDAEASEPGGPLGGLTVVKFRNAHLVYAMTWYGLAALTVIGAVLVFRSGRLP